VARVAEVSIGTASKALNRTGHLRQETRDKVLGVAREIGYRPNDLAQSLHRARSMTVGLITNDSFGRFSFPIFEALEEKLADQGIAVFMCNATDDPSRERQHIDQLMRKRNDRRSRMCHRVCRSSMCTRRPTTQTLSASCPTTWAVPGWRSTISWLVADGELRTSRAPSGSRPCSCGVPATRRAWLPRVSLTTRRST
jgi:hypothetical protein